MNTVLWFDIAQNLFLSAHVELMFVSAQFTYFYHVIPVEPNTPWKDNVEELHKKTQHGVPADKIKEMLRNLKSQQLRPLYYGWFLTQKDSKALFDLGAKCLREGVEAIGDGQLERINPAGKDFYLTMPNQSSYRLVATKWKTFRLLLQDSHMTAILKTEKIYTLYINSKVLKKT